MGGYDVAIAVLSLAVGIPILIHDARTHRIPNRLVLPAIAVALLIGLAGAIVRGTWSDLRQMLLTGGAAFVIGYLLAALSPEGFGFGDVKLLAFIGLAMGHLAPSLVIIWLQALVVTTVLWLLASPWVDKQADRQVPLLKRQIAFGPPMLLALWITYVVVVVLQVKP